MPPSKTSTRKSGPAKRTIPARCNASNSASRRGGGPLARNEKKPWNSPSTNRTRSAALILPVVSATASTP